MKLKKLVQMTGLALLIPAFVSCSLFKGDETEIRSIDNITYAEDETGEFILVTVHYTDETEDSFEVPKGKAGEDGASIEKIESVTDRETGETTITITYTNGETDEITFTTRSIKTIHQEVVDDHLELTIEYTDGTFSDTFTVYNGVDGEPGVGVDHVSDPEIQDDGSVKFTIYWTDENETEVTIPRGEKGNGIDHMESGTTDESYYLTIYFTDGEKETFYFDIPSQWHNVQEKPTPSEFDIGDYAFDIIHHKIYYKDSTGTWILVADFSTNETLHSVSFDLNADDAIFAIGQSYYEIYNAQTFYSSHYDVPVATRPNYTFGGWSTSKTPNPTNGLFTDLTPVMSDMVLYAIWNN